MPDPRWRHNVLLRKALELDPDNQMYIDNLRRAEHKANKVWIGLDLVWFACSCCCCLFGPKGWVCVDICGFERRGSIQDGIVMYFFVVVFFDSDPRAGYMLSMWFWRAHHGLCFPLQHAASAAELNSGQGSSDGRYMDCILSTIIIELDAILIQWLYLIHGLLLFSWMRSSRLQG
jgi:hypothetical protein